MRARDQSASGGLNSLTSAVFGELASENDGRVDVERKRA